MKRIFKLLSMMLAVSTALSSCLGDDEETFITTYRDMMIETFTLGTLNRYQTYTSSTGSDSVVKTMFSGSQYPMTIDHVNRIIYNQDSLPMGTDTRHVICTITAKNNGVVYLKLLDRDSLYYHNSTDSVDFSVERIFRVYAIDGSGHRDYTVKLNVSNYTGTQFEWTRLSASNTGIGNDQLDGHKLLVFGGSMWLFAQQQGATNIYKAVATDESYSWQKQSLVGTASLHQDAWQSVVAKDGTLYLLNDQQLLSSTDGTNWQVANAATPITKLVAASSTELYGLSADGTMMRSADSGATWIADHMEHQADATLLPNDSIAAISWPYANTDSTDYVLLIGACKSYEDSDLLVWRKLCQSNNTDNSGQWTYMPYDDNNPYRLPRQGRPSLVRYQNTLLAICGNQKVYQSRDQGLSWRENATYSLPASETDTKYTMCTDDSGFLWLCDSNGQLWMGNMW